MRVSRIYYFSNYDNCVHNINDVKYNLIDENTVEIKRKDNEEWEIIDTVNLHTLEEILKIFSDFQLK